MATKVTSEEVYETLRKMGDITSSTVIACKLGVSSSTVKTHLGRLREEGRVFMTKKDFTGQMKWGIGDGAGHKVVRFRSDTGGKHNFEIRKPGRRPGTLADVPPKRNWWG